MSDTMPAALDLPAVRRKKLTVSFDGGQLSSDGGLLLLREAERRLGIAGRLAGAIRDRRDPMRIDHTLPELLKTRMFAIACGYEDANDLDRLRHDPLLRLAVGRCPKSGDPLCSQSTMSRLENMPSRIEAARMTAALVDQFCASFPRTPKTLTLDIDDTVDAVHGGQQLSFWNAHHDCRCFLPIHVYHVESGRPVVMILREGKTPSGEEVRTVIKHLTRRIHRHFPKTRITWRGDSHYGRPQAMRWCEDNTTGFIFGLGGNAVLDRLCREAADDLCVRRAEAGAETMRAFTSFPYQARSWDKPRKVVARIEATAQGLDIRYVVTSLPGRAQDLYEAVYCERGQAENLIKLHKTQLASDRTSCHSPVANQMRLVLHTAAYWLMLTLREAIPQAAPLAKAEFVTIRAKLIKIAARVIEHTARIRVHLPTGCPEQDWFGCIAVRLAQAVP
jgi:Transposase DDE domain group 1